MSIPDAPWVGKCKEDYYGYDEQACCECCGEEYPEDELVYHNGEFVCEECFQIYYNGGRTDDEELCG